MDTLVLWGKRYQKIKTELTTVKEKSFTGYVCSCV